ncbi:hypothetical protein DRW07_14790 [Alteromonas sediminis]|uniref:Uncharacterized protein n=1 Tax=Alteromonas sediminis TaxID=2259342 RepID=A0A3N5Z6A0_9ALTE|nr:hypothetical protein [Alteromonas sediminis]RPJ66064.1 hypothetical protein DRW07_14790 [Alteromonas sediminis]
MSKKEFITSIFFICFFTFLLQIWIIGDLADQIAKLTGYLVAIAIVPFLIAIVPTSILLFAKSKPVPVKLKLWLYILPLAFTGLLLLYMLIMLNSGAH